MKLAGLGCCLLLVANLGACGGGGDAAPAATGDILLALDAKVERQPAVRSEAVLVWNVVDGQPDYAYVWGRADIRDAAFSLTLRTRPPAEALSKLGLGVARFLSVSASARLPEGKVQDQDEQFARAINGASRFAVVFVDHDMVNAALSDPARPLTEEAREEFREHWLFDFPPGYSCAEGRPAAAGETFDSLVPMDCSRLDISAGTDVPFPNWT